MNATTTKTWKTISGTNAERQIERERIENNDYRKIYTYERSKTYHIEIPDKVIT